MVLSLNSLYLVITCNDKKKIYGAIIEGDRLFTTAIITKLVLSTVFIIANAHTHKQMTRKLVGWSETSIILLLLQGR